VLALAAALIMACVGLAGAADSSAVTGLRSAKHVVICHELGNGGWVRIAPSVQGVLSAHAHHPRDIIPPFDYQLSTGKTGHFPGLNWDAEGQVIWENGCVLPARSPANALAAEHIGVFVTCVDVGASTYDATFGYQSNNATDVSIAVGSANGFSPAPANRGQVTVFGPGEVANAFTVAGIPVGTQLTWTVSYAGHTSTATVSSSFGLPCAKPESAGPRVGIFVRCVTNHGDTFDATFGYQNDDPATVTIPVGASNLFSPAPENRGQTTSFLPGDIPKAFTATGIPARDDLVWTLTSDEARTATATADFETKCSEPPHRSDRSASS
jgi:hypothetical protein